MGTSENIQAWSKTASTNSSADSSINWAEGQDPGSVNNSARSVMAATKKYAEDRDGGLAAGGTGNAITLTTNQVLSAGHIAAGLTLSFRATATNTGATTLNVDSTGAVSVVDQFGAALGAGAITSGGIYTVAYNANTSKWVLQTPAVLPSAAAPTTNYQAFTSDGTWTKPATVKSSSRVHVQAWGAGGGGGAHATGGGGGGGAYAEGWFLASSLSATESVTVPAGGAVNTAGGNAAFGSLLTAYGGANGTNGASGSGGGGGGALGAATTYVGGSPNFTSATVYNGGWGGGNGGITGSSGVAGNAVIGGGGGGQGNASGAGTNGGSSLYGGGGGAGKGTSGSPVGGTSVFGGAGGAPEVAGSAPGGGGGRNAAGGRAEVRVTTYI